MDRKDLQIKKKKNQDWMLKHLKTRLLLKTIRNGFPE